MKKIIYKIINVIDNLRDKFRKEKYLVDYLIEDIAQKTGFKESKIKLQISERSNPDIPRLDHHEFTYEGKFYILSNYSDPLSLR